MTRVIVFGLALCLVSAVGCRSSDEPKSGDQHGEDYLRCADPYDDGQKEIFRLPPLVVERNGYDVTVQGIERGLVVLGVIAGITEPTVATAQNIAFFLEQFKAAKVQAILVPGGLGLLPEHAETIVKLLASAPIPVLVTPGAEENLDVFRTVIAKQRQKNPQILDMTRIRRVRIGNVNIVSLPGYYRAFYLKAGERGCAYDIKDLGQTASLFIDRLTNVILSPTPPRGTGEHAVDRGRGDVNIGDKELTEVLESNEIKFGLFGYVSESGGHATAMDGSTATRPAVWKDSLFLQAGSAEALPVTLIGGGRSVGMAHIVEFSGNRGRYRTIFATPNHF
jgi:Icc-related predicted phosphoesterase